MTSGGGGIFFPLFGPLIVSVRLGYLKAVSTSCCRPSVLQKSFSSLSSVHHYSEVLKKQLIILTQGPLMPQHGGTPIYPILRSSSAVKIKVNNQLEIFSIVNSQATIYTVKLVKILAIKPIIVKLPMMIIIFLVKILTTDEDRYTGVPPLA